MSIEQQIARSNQWQGISGIVQRLSAILCAIARPSLTQLVSRFALAVPFWRSGVNKWDGFLQLSDVATLLFSTEFKLHLPGGPPEGRVSLLHGSLTYRDDRWAGADAATLVEVIEHLDPDRLPIVERVLFGEARPAAVVVTTPNAEYNALFPNLAAGAFAQKVDDVIAEQMLEKVVAPLGRRSGPSDFQAAADCISRPARAECALPAEALRLDLTTLRIHADM